MIINDAAAADDDDDNDGDDDYNNNNNNNSNINKNKNKIIILANRLGCDSGLHLRWFLCGGFGSRGRRCSNDT